MKKIFIIMTVFFLALTSLTGCGRKRFAKEKEEAIPVKVMKVASRNLSKALEYVGNIKGVDEATVYPKVTGKIIEKVAEEGSPVKKGDPIMYIDRDEIGLKFEKAPVESPLTGILGRVYVDIGANVKPETPVALVSNMEMVEIDLNIPEKYMPKVTLGENAVISVDAHPGMEFAGKVTEISPVVDLETRSAPVEITIDDDEHLLRSGMFAKVKLVIEEHKNVPAVLKEAIMGKAPDTYVYLVENKKAILRKITPGIREGALVEVLGGLKGGDMVVIMGQQKLRDGSTVEPEE